MGVRTHRFEGYVSLIAEQLEHADRVEPLYGHCTGCCCQLRTRAWNPTVAHLAPANLRSEHQRLHHFVADAAWSDEAALVAVRAHDTRTDRQACEQVGSGHLCDRI